MRRSFRRHDRIAAAVLGGLLLAGCAQAHVTGESPAFRRFAEQMQREHGFDADRVERLLESTERQQDIIDAMRSPAEALPWHRYRPIFLTDKRIRKGVKFWGEHDALLRDVAAQYGVPPRVIVAIIGVETYYGGYTGSHRVIDALRTLAFDYPPRSDFFRSELEQYLLLAREENFDPLRPKGSYAGAMGLPQFISSSYRAYAVDFNGNGQRDLWDEKADVFGSVANYLGRHGWERGAPVAVPARLEGDAWRGLTDDGLKPNTTVGELRKHGVEPLASGIDDSRRARLLLLEGEDGRQAWVTFNNFYVITRYNHSALYAMAVHQLAEAIAEQRSAQL